MHEYAFHFFDSFSPSFCLWLFLIFFMTFAFNIKGIFSYGSKIFFSIWIPGEIKISSHLSDLSIVSLDKARIVTRGFDQFKIESVLRSLLEHASQSFQIFPGIFPNTPQNHLMHSPVSLITFPGSFWTFSEIFSNISRNLLEYYPEC